eukprot:CAMPEP_0206225426 /NCGR_PEP_ID=MMETSP0047_2-20121206/7541_1 /ASSEMBLY_ACC=CAM_ASM_000192 /TAXON_ID=195065 /ORGANISM="Chroomonas mesostigmatica_cf, Strain CCMP1168" /LENGTH=372 /DNA_ID=CAMNT_0053648425 /DNA_START=320 /DNA_END=1435 /DNA_ORIENTATION=+
MIAEHLRVEHHHVASPQQANLLNKTAAAAEEFKRLLAAEQEWQEERAQYQADMAKAIQEVDKQTSRVRRLEELRVSEAAAWRKEREQVVRDKEAASARITALIRELELKSQAEARFNLERKSWAERVERIEKIASDSKLDAKNAGEEVTRLQRAYQDIFAKSRTEKELMSRELQICQEESADLRQRLHGVQEQYKGAQAQMDAMDRAVTEYRRTLTLLGQERDDLQKQLTNMEHEIGDVLQQLATAQDALESEKQAHAAALEFERSERQRQQDFFAKALQEAEAEARSAASQVHAQKLRVVQLERETKRLREETVQLQMRLRIMDGELSKERSEWEATYQQLTEAIATKEMEQDAAAAHLEIMLRSVATGDV